MVLMGRERESKKRKRKMRRRKMSRKAPGRQMTARPRCVGRDIGRLGCRTQDQNKEGREAT